MLVLKKDRRSDHTLAGPRVLGFYVPAASYLGGTLVLVPDAGWWPFCMSGSVDSEVRELRAQQ